MIDTSAENTSAEESCEESSQREGDEDNNEGEEEDKAEEDEAEEDEAEEDDARVNLRCQRRRVLVNHERDRSYESNAHNLFEFANCGKLETPWFREECTCMD